LTNDGIARAAQALAQRRRSRSASACAACAPRVAQSFLRQTEYIIRRSMFDVLQFLSRFDWPLFRPAAPLESEQKSMIIASKATKDHEHNFY
jgi:hypothetical protein